MKEKEIKEKYGIDSIFDFTDYLRRNKLPYSETPFTGAIIVEDNTIEEYVAGYKSEQQEKKRQIEEKEAREAEEDARKKKAMAEMLITSGFSFEGYKITKYSGYISGDDAVSVDRGWGGHTNVGEQLMESLTVIRRNALRELKEAAYALGCNAVIGVDFDYLTLDPQTASVTGGTVYQPYVFGVTANGNAVVIEKNEE